MVAFTTLVLFSTIAVRFNIVNSVHNFITLSVENQYYMYICIFLFITSFFFIRVSLKLVIQTPLNTVYSFFIMLTSIPFIYITTLSIKANLTSEILSIDPSQIYKIFFLTVITYLCSNLKKIFDFFFLIFFFKNQFYLCVFVCYLYIYMRFFENISTYICT